MRLGNKHFNIHYFKVITNCTQYHLNISLYPIRIKISTVIGYQASIAIGIFKFLFELSVYEQSYEE